MHDQQEKRSFYSCQLCNQEVGGWDGILKKQIKSFFKGIHVLPDFRVLFVNMINIKFISNLATQC